MVNQFCDDMYISPEECRRQRAAPKPENPDPYDVYDDEIYIPYELRRENPEQDNQGSFRYGDFGGSFGYGGFRDGGSPIGYAVIGAIAGILIAFAFF